MKKPVQQKPIRTGKIRITKITITPNPRPTNQRPADTVMTRFWIGISLFVIVTTGAFLTSPSDFYEAVKQTFFH